MNFGLLHPRDQLVQIMDRIYRYGLTTTSGGNLSILDDNGDLWITPAAVDKGNLEPRDIMCLRPDGQGVGPHTLSTEYPFHQVIYRRRPDARAIVHAHSPALISFSIARIIPDTRIIPQAHHVCGEVGYAPYALPGSWQLGENIANTFARGFGAVLLENHGIVTVGPDLLAAFQRLETLELCARTQILASSLASDRAPVHALTGEQIAQFESRSTDLPTFQPRPPSSRERELRQAICRMVHRAYDRRLMTSTEGTVSARVDGDSFLITPYGVDRKLLDLEDIVLIENGHAEQGKRPSRAARLHQAIFTDHPGIQCIITAQCPHAMAYAVAGRSLDSRTIPESYVVLRNVPLVPYGLPYDTPEQVSAVLSKRSPAVLIQNDTLLTTGATIHQAFDRLEVADFTAMSLINTEHIGPLAPIGEAEVRDLEARFG
jgi:L-fuculose-phosphate aldolase